MTQPPALLAVSKAFIAGTPCPWPREIIKIYYDFFYNYLESLRRLCKGSAPTDKIKTRGTLLDTSEYI